ncbi:hypothetical protein NEOLEDRAFT_986098 [Neolentinus lepideus HHB14362 ss-1]|uniref:F-box domain-containing protein n=1 Tax=Neolentinus lepideus HHB14362 ss-1 TaxID=1314782 RepID=A0A165N507_9AGAM|nr:hypothetical protein NEOLEDRAFT_986098 [Neolentinus lepideus HHB14362 ss-1]
MSPNTPPLEPDMTGYVKPNYTAATAPEEIISHIASFVVEDTRARDNEAPPPSKWFSLTAVCKRWTNAIANTAAPWAGITIGSIESLQKFLSRSRNEPLTVKGDLSDGDEENAEKFSMVMQHTHRLQSLCISVSHSVLNRLVSLGGYGLTPHLEVLEVTKTGLERTSALQWFSDSQLRILRLTGFHFSDFSFLLDTSLTALTELSLANIEWNPVVDEMLNLLGQLPQLKRLQLGIVMTWSLNPSETTSLPALRYLALYNLGATEAYLLFVLDTPSLEYLGLKIVPTLHLGYILYTVQDKIDQVCTRAPLRGCGMHSEGPGGKFYYMLTEDAASKTCIEQDTGLLLVFEGFGIAGEHAITDIVYLYTWAYVVNVQHLTVDNYSAHTQPVARSWLRLFQFMPAVQTLQLWGQHSSVFATGLCIPRELDGAWQPLFSALLNINFLAVWFRPSTDVDGPDEENSLIERLVKPYQSCDNPQELITLTIRESCNIADYEVELLRYAFTSEGVEWDGRQEWCDPDPEWENSVSEDDGHWDDENDGEGDEIAANAAEGTEDMGDDAGLTIEDVRGVVDEEDDADEVVLWDDGGAGYLGDTEEDDCDIDW